MTVRDGSLGEALPSLLRHAPCVRTSPVAVALMVALLGACAANADGTPPPGRGDGGFGELGADDLGAGDASTDDLGASDLGASDLGASDLGAPDAARIRLTCEACTSDAECGERNLCYMLSDGAGRACLPGCEPDLPSCPRAFSCDDPRGFDFVCLPVGVPCCVDEDADGYGIGVGCTGPDCGAEGFDDGDASRNPGASDVCNGIDDDCDGRLDEDPTNCAIAECDLAADGVTYQQVGAEVCTDGVCTPPAAEGCGLYTCDRTGADGSRCATLCNPTGFDNSAYCIPGASCRGGVCVRDLGPGDPCTATAECGRGLSCVDGVCCTSASCGACGVCNAPGLAGLCAPRGDTGAPEVCNDLDDDCDGAIDEGCDDDGDDFCDAGLGYVAVPSACPRGGNDCDDGNPAANPGAAEICNGVDDDCTLGVDQGRTCVRCGDGLIDVTYGEVCDDGNTTSGDGCNATCTAIECGPFPNGTFYVAASGNCYWRSTEVVGSRATASTRCTDRGMHLGYLETPAERSDVRGNLIGFSSTSRVYVGINTTGRCRTCGTWLNGVALTYDFFRSGEPSGDGTCAEWGPSELDGNDIPCGTSRDFVCERERAGTVRVLP